MKIKIARIILPALFLLVPVAAQTGGAFTIEKSVIASGGGTSSGGAFTVLGTTGQPSAGIATGAPFTLFGAFITPSPAPTAAGVTVSGRVFVSDGAGLRNAVVLLTDSFGNTRTTRTGSFGYFRFDEVEAGQTYVFSIQSKRFQFNPQVVAVNENLEELNFTAIQ